MVKDVLRSCAQRLGVNVVSTSRLGVEPELDLLRLSAQQPLRTIFDVGGNFGQTALRFAAAFPAATIRSFEPVPESYAKLVQATRHEPRIRPFNLALGERSGTVKLNVTPSAGSNTLLATKSSIASVDVGMETVDSVAQKHRIEAIDLLKIDVEGYELQVLAGAQRLLKTQRIRFVFTECVFSPDLSQPHTNFLDLHSLLERSGFCVVCCYTLSFGLRSGCALANVLFALRAGLPASAPGKIRNVF